MIAEIMHDDHRACDDHFTACEEAAEAGDLAAAQAAFDRFVGRMEDHFRAEEEQLFPAFEARGGQRGGPTEVMRFEHRQMREGFDAARAALATGDGDAFLGQLETLLVVMQQHNLKEEQVLYPLCERLLAAEAPALAARLRALLAE